MSKNRLVRCSSLLGVPVALSALSGCLGVKEELKDSAAVVSSSSGSTTVADASINAGLYFQFKTAWETDDTDFTTQGTCQIALNAAVGTTTTCNIAVPEAQLFFSKLTYVVGSADSTQCKRIIFRPYYYLGSTAAAFTPNWDATQTEVDCSTSPIPAECYNGVAAEIVTDFPSYRSMYFLTNLGQETTFNADSANNKTKLDNTYSCNNLADPSAAAGVYAADGYSFVGGSTAGTTNYDSRYQNYIVECRDEWNELVYKITARISDEDLSTGETPGVPATDHYPDWSGL